MRWIWNVADILQRVADHLTHRDPAKYPQFKLTRIPDEPDFTRTSTHHRDILETGNDSYRFKQRKKAAENQ